MKNNRDTKSKNSSREHQRKQSVGCSNTLITKISKSIPLTIPARTGLGTMNSTRLKSRGESKNSSNPNSRKGSFQQQRKQSVVGIKLISKETHKKEHNRSNSTISKKSTSRQIKNSFKIDISKLVAKHQNDNKILIEKEPKEVCRAHFNYQYVIGKGGFGKVWSVEFKRSKKIYAMKEMMKSKIIAKKSIHSVLNQRELLSKLKHPFIVNMAYAFQDRENLYLVMDLLVGGDLRYHMGRRRKFKQSEAKFFIACILVGLEFLHLNNIIHRDIKPQNLVFDEKGYLRITDLGIARQVKPNNSADTSGTPGYMAPEVMCRQDHSFSVDYYAVGVIAYEFMMGKRPYFGRNRKQIRDQILSKQVQVRPDEAPEGWSHEAIDFINRMIQRKPANRLGTENGVVEIKDHPWFKNFSWAQLIRKNLQAPFTPKSIAENVDYREQISSTSEDENQQQNMLLLRKKSVEDLFQGYSYYCKQKEKKSHNSTNTANLPTTANTHYSYMEEKDSHRGAKPKSNNFFKQL